MAGKCAGCEFLAYMHITGIQPQPEFQDFEVSQKPLAPPSHILEVPFQSVPVPMSPRLLELFWASRTSGALIAMGTIDLSLNALTSPPHFASPYPYSTHTLQASQSYLNHLHSSRTNDGAEHKHFSLPPLKDDTPRIPNCLD
jgi:hypothetical protein